MVSFQNLTLGQQTEFNRILAASGFQKEDVELMNKHPEIVERLFWVFFTEALKHRPALIEERGYKPAWVRTQIHRYTPGFRLDA